jgi:hypothetical protein
VAKEISLRAENDVKISDKAQTLIIAVEKVHTILDDAVEDIEGLLQDLAYELEDPEDEESTD